MSLLVAGSIGIDSVETPHARATDVLGGSAVYFSVAASLFGPVRLVGVVGEDFPDEFRRVLTLREIDLAGLEVRAGGKTFRWRGRYEGAMNEAETVGVELNVLAERGATVPEAFRDSRIVFLANSHPDLQRDSLRQLRAPRISVCDTIDLWIKTQRDSLLETLSMVSGVILNEGEARLLSGKMNLIEAGEWLLDRGLRFAVIKKGEHGVLLVTGEGVAAVPAYPTKDVRDPTGAGDSFAGGFMGYLATQPVTDFDTMRRAMVRGTVCASFTIEDFSLNRIHGVTRANLDGRISAFVQMLRLE